MIQKLFKFIIFVLPLWCGILVKGLQDSNFSDFTEKDVTLIVPQIGEKGSDVTMYCKFDSKATAIYSVKWYKGNREIFRFTPKERPEKKDFPIEGHVLVDVNQSDINKIVIRNIPMMLTGNITCEVTPETTSMKPIQKREHFTVIAIQDPTLEVLSSAPNLLKHNEKVQLRCKVGPTKPPAKLTFFINNMTLWSGNNRERQVRLSPPSNDSDKSNGYEAREAEIPVTLSSSQFIDNKVEFRCAATIFNLTRSSNAHTASLYTPPQTSYSPYNNAALSSVISNLGDLVLLLGLQLFLLQPILLTRV